MTLTIKITFSKNQAENKVGRLIPDFFLFFKKALYDVKASCLEFSFNKIY